MAFRLFGQRAPGCGYLSWQQDFQRDEQKQNDLKVLKPFLFLIQVSMAVVAVTNLHFHLKKIQNSKIINSSRYLD